MRDKRPVDELSIEELERILSIRKREARQDQLNRMQRRGRIVSPSKEKAMPESLDAILVPDPSQPAYASLKTAANPQFEDDVSVATTRSRSRKDREGSIWQRFVDRSLIVVEIAAVIGLIFLGFQLFQGIGFLQDKTAEAQAAANEQLIANIPTIAPTPQLQLSAIVLPGGHTPPTEAGGGQFNFSEIPEHLRSTVSNEIFLPPNIQRPVATEDTPLRLLIPKLNVDQAIVQGIDWEALKLGIGQVPNGAEPSNGTANVVLAAHNDIYGEIFRHLDELSAGDQFQIQTRTNIYTYTITGWDIVNPDDVHVMESRGYASATLISCYPYQVNNKRIVIFAQREEV